MNVHRPERLEEFRRLPAEDVARLVREAGPKVCVFPINGTRRWFMLEHSSGRLSRTQGEDFASAYLDMVTKRHIEVYRLLFEHGLDTLLTPAFGPDLMERGGGYMQMAAEGLAQLTNHPAFLDFYQAYDVRVRFYGDYHRFLDHTPYAYLCDLFARATEETSHHERCRLFFGLFAHDATETIAGIALRFYQAHGHLPNRREIVEAYYGEYVESVDLFIGFDRFSAFDMPLVATGSEDLYFTVNPSLYLDERQLRDILYDHLYLRRAEPDYVSMTADDWRLMRDFYRANHGMTQGVGLRRGNVWYPLPQVELPPGFAESVGETQ
jgi:hypothetical protein